MRQTETKQDVTDTSLDRQREISTNSRRREGVRGGGGGVA